MLELREILEDYELNFCQKKCTVETGYRQLPEFTVLFEVTDLFHLLGMHKLTTKYRASRWVKAVKEDHFDLKRYADHHAFRDVLLRINNYSFFYEIFYQDKVQLCVLEKDLKTNTMKLSVIFYKQEQKRIVVMGLKKGRDGYFRPATLHEGSHNKYKSVKHTVIKGLKWHK